MTKLNAWAGHRLHWLPEFALFVLGTAWAESDPVAENIRQRVEQIRSFGAHYVGNDHLVYLHDTPSKALFERSTRTLSSGCIRLEKPFELGALLLNNPHQWSSEKIQEVVNSRKTQAATGSGAYVVLDCRG